MHDMDLSSTDLTGTDLSGTGLTGTDLARAEWRKASHSSTNGGNCVEVAANLPGIVAVRDSKNPSGPALVVTPADWAAFTTGIKAGHFTLA